VGYLEELSMFLVNLALLLSILTSNDN